MQKLTINAPAKLNLTLGITGIAPNSYHTLDMVMQTVSLCDTVTLEQCDELKLVCPPWLPAGPENLALRAAEKLRDFTAVQKGALITLEKLIPAQAGMGGGSADAAAVLRGLNELWELGLTLDELYRVGLCLGSDVPFAVAGGAARVQGVGELVEKIEGAKPLWFTLAKPAGGVGTAEAYRLYDNISAGPQPDNDRFIAALQAGDIAGMARFGGNALENAAVQLLPSVGRLIGRMKTTGTGYCAMTGSGSAVFAVFETEAEAMGAIGKIKSAAWTAVACSC